jgi:flagellar hook assembly protein FlgD
MSFIPASLPNNSCQINYTPVLYEDGVYQLLVQAKDKSDNQSGSIDYKINFEVINKSTITEVMNYPNPFSTATRFVFTLTGSEEPTNFKIQIMTITGKVVREIYQDEIGPIHIGRNITEFAWDGKDEFGDQLANGVYLYHVITRINGSEIEKRETAADQFFKKGWGKMYLMR